jgi:hypothetical protein
MRSRTISALVLLAAAALQAAPAAAQLKVGGGGVEVAGPNNTAAVQPVAGDAGTMTVRDMRRQGGQTLRCWQNGRLLYEGSGFRGGVGGANAISVPRRAEGDPVVVLNLQHAICILSDN